MAKHDSPFIEITTRLFIPLADLETTSLAALLKESGKLVVKKVEKRRKSTKTDAPQ